MNYLVWAIVCFAPWLLFIGVTLIFDKYGCDVHGLFGQKSRARKSRLTKFGKREEINTRRTSEEMEKLLSK